MKLGKSVSAPQVFNKAKADRSDVSVCNLEMNMNEMTEWEMVWCMDEGILGTTINIFILLSETVYSIPSS